MRLGSTGGEHPGPPGDYRAAKHAVPAIAVLLAACAGATDVPAFFGLGKAFAGIVTGNLVTAGYGNIWALRIHQTTTVQARIKRQSHGVRAAGQLRAQHDRSRHQDGG